MTAKRAAAQPGSQVLERLRRELAAGWPPGLTVLTGDDLFHLDRAQRLLIDTLVAGEDAEFALTVFGEEKIDVSKLVAAARSAGMFASKRVVFLREIALLDGEPAALEAYAKSPPPESYVIVRAPVLDQRRKLHKAVAKSGRMVAFGAAAGDPRAMHADIGSLAAERKLQLDQAARGFLAEVTLGDLYRVSTELDKLDAWKGGSGLRKLSLADVQQVAAGSALMSGWEVADAILDRDHGAALTAVRRLIEGGEEPLRILGGIAWRSRALLQARAMVEKGMQPGQVVNSVQAWGFQRKLEGALRRYTMAEVTAFPSHLLYADRSIKSRSVAPRVVLEELIDQLIRGREPA